MHFPIPGGWLRTLIGVLLLRSGALGESTVQFEAVKLEGPGPVATVHRMWCPDAPVPPRRPVILMLGSLDSNAPPDWSANLLQEGWMLCAFSVAHPPDICRLSCPTGR